MLGSACHPCCGSCQKLDNIWPDLVALPVAYHFECNGAAGFPAVTVDETVTAGTWDTIPLPGQASQWGRKVTGDYEGRMYTLDMYLYYISRYSWGAAFALRYYEYPSGTSGVNSATHYQTGVFEYRCDSGTTLVEPKGIFSDFNYQYYSDYVEPGSTYEGQGGCCCAQYGPVAIVGNGGICTGAIRSPYCDEALSEYGTLVGICKRRSAPFLSRFEFSRYHSQYGGRFVFFTVTLPDWRMYRTNPLP